MKRPWPGKQPLLYSAALAGCLALAIAAGWTAPAAEFDDYLYDWMSRLNPPPASPPGSIVLAIDDDTLNARGGQRQLRSIVAEAMDLARTANPDVLAIDVILADKGDDREDFRLEQSLRGAPNLALAADSVNGAWEMPLPRFAKSAAAVGHVEADERSDDGVTRRISLESVAGHVRLWALSLAAFRLSRGAKAILESPEDLDVAGAVIPIALGPRDRRPMRIRYTSDPLPTLSVQALARNPSLGQMLRGKTVFLGVTSMSATRDRIRTPYGATLSGVQIHAQAFETMRRGAFLRDARDSSVLLFCALITFAAGIVFAFASGWPAYLLGAALIAVAQWLPFTFFAHGLVFPYVSPLLTAWLSVSCAASFQHFLVRGRLRRAEKDRTRYRQAIQFVTHEMRTPLTAIQGSSELMGRYNLTDDKRRQIASMIHSESKRLATMIQTFLDVERLSAGQMEMKREPVDLCAVLRACLERVRPLADKKNIAVHSTAGADAALEGDSEMLGYAVYNLLTNAVKYSPPGTEVRYFCRTP